jgi:hypothetical protein
LHILHPLPEQEIISASPTPLEQSFSLTVYFQPIPFSRASSCHNYFSVDLIGTLHPQIIIIFFLCVLTSLSREYLSCFDSAF